MSYICWKKVDIKSKENEDGQFFEFIKIKGRNLKSQEAHP